MEKGELSQVVHQLLHKIVPALPITPQEQQLSNYKGRSPNDSILIPTPAIRDHELLLIGGRVLVQLEHPNHNWEPFQATVTTDFKEFLGATEVTYQLHEYRSRSLPLFLPLELLADAVTIEIEKFRFGLEHFRPMNRGLFRGYTPAVEETLLIDGVQDRLAFILRVDGSTREIRNPLTEVPIFEKILQILSKEFGCDLPDHFLSQLKARNKDN